MAYFMNKAFLISLGQHLVNACVVACSSASTTQALAWGQEGHSVIAEIGERRLSGEATASVQSLPGKGHSLASISSWADDVRPKRPTTSNWHFADIPIESDDYKPDRDCKPDAAKRDCIVAELDRLKSELRCGPRESRTEALMFAVHFVGDIHQPLHTVLEEFGGNSILVNLTAADLICTTNCQPVETNFHRAWDSDLIHKTVFSWGTYVDRLETGWLKGSEAKQFGVAGGKPADWVVETHRYAKKVWKSLPSDTMPIDGIEYRIMDDKLTRKPYQFSTASLGLESCA
jgi:hypothetical protein